ncbi:MAG TPA: TolC family outer membrane protein [Rhizomicrobium sp.]
MTLDEALAVVYQTNPQLAAEGAQLRATDEEVAKADAGWRPTISSSGSYGLEYQHTSPSSFFGPKPGTAPTLTSQITLSQPVFTSGRTVAEIDRARALFRQERARFLGTEETVLLNAATAFFDVIRDSKIFTLQQENVAALQKLLNAAQKEFALQDVTKTDVAQAQARLAGAQAQLATAQGNLAASRAAFQQVVGHKPDVLRAPRYPDLPVTEPEVLAAALKLNPSLTGAMEAERAAAYAIDDAMGALGPQVSLQGQYLYQKNSAATAFFGTDHVGVVAAQVTLPIYQGGAEYAEVRQQEALHGQSQLQILNSERQVRQAAEASWNTFRAAQAAIQLNLAQQGADEIAYEGVQKEQKAGTRTVLDVLNAEQELVNAKIALVQSEHDAHVDAFQILGVMGLLEAKHLGLKVRLYDLSEQYPAGSWLSLTE